MNRLFFQKPFKYKFFNATLYIIGINVLVFLLTNMYPRANLYLALNPAIMIQYSFYWQPLTYMFVHGSWMHLFCNMITLLCFGITLEKTIGSREFLLFYFVTGILTGVLSFVYYRLTGQYRVFLMGASGAIYAVLLAFSVVYPQSRIFVWGLIPVPAPLLVLVYAVIEIFCALTGTRAGTAHLAHLFGLLVGFLYFIIRMKINPFKRWKNC